MKKLLVNINFFNTFRAENFCSHIVYLDHTPLSTPFLGSSYSAIRVKKCYFHGCSLLIHETEIKIGCCGDNHRPHTRQVRGSKCNTSFSFFHCAFRLLPFFSLSVETRLTPMHARILSFLCLFLSTFVLLFI